MVRIPKTLGKWRLGQVDSSRMGCHTQQTSADMAADEQKGTRERCARGTKGWADGRASRRISGARLAVDLLGVVDEALLLAVVRRDTGHRPRQRGPARCTAPSDRRGRRPCSCASGRIVCGSSVKRSTTCSLSLWRTGKVRKPGRKPTVSTTSTSPSQRPIECPARDRLDVGRMRLQVQVDRALQVHLPVLDDDVSLVLRDAVDRAVERPVEDDAGGLALEARVVVPGWPPPLPSYPGRSARCRRRAAVPRARAAATPSAPLHRPCGQAAPWPCVLSGTRPPPTPRGSAITICSGAQSPARFGSPVGRRGSRLTATSR